LLKYLTQTFMSHCKEMICQPVTLSGYAEWPKVADAVIEALPNKLLNMGFFAQPPSCPAWDERGWAKNPCLQSRADVASEHQKPEE
jgi:hypothetical protein